MLQEQDTASQEIMIYVTQSQQVEMNVMYFVCSETACCFAHVATA